MHTYTVHLYVIFIYPPLITCFASSLSTDSNKFFFYCFRLVPLPDVLSEKDIQDAIGACFSKGSKQQDLELRSSMVSEAITKLLGEAGPPPFQTMRTLLLGCRVLPELVKYMLTSAVPTLVRGRCWEVMPRVWDGVLHCVKKYHVGHTRDGIESTFRAILGLPVKQLSIALQVCEEGVRKTLGNIVRALSPAEKEEVLSGKWIGLSDLNKDGESEAKLRLLNII